MEYVSLARFAFAFLLVISLIGLMGVVLRRYAAGRGWQADAKAERRVRIIETLPLSAQQRIILLQRDDKAHLLLVSPQSSLVIEQDIPLPDAPKALKKAAGKGATKS